jgi:hypothetical protein
MLMHLKTLFTIFVIPTILLYTLVFVGCKKEEQQESSGDNINNIKEQSLSKSDQTIESQFSRDKNAKRSFELKVCTDIQKRLDNIDKNKDPENIQTQKNKIVDHISKKYSISKNQVDSIWERFSGENIYDPDHIAEEIDTIAKQTEIQKKCPENMAFAGLLCVDLYEYPNKKGEMPEGNLTWYQAQAKCAESGKRLCSENEWVTACKGFKNQLFPYGPKYNSDICNTGKSWEQGIARSGSFDACVSDYGIYDMSGNLSEWTGENDSLSAIKGGSFEDIDSYVTCGSVIKLAPSSQFKQTGFRCCKKLE